jgi:hypothetical protein
LPVLDADVVQVVVIVVVAVEDDVDVLAEGVLVEGPHESAVQIEPLSQW